jgi:hypothetical protein
VSAAVLTVCAPTRACARGQAVSGRHLEAHPLGPLIGWVTVPHHVPG